MEFFEKFFSGLAELAKNDPFAMLMVIVLLGALCVLMGGYVASLIIKREAKSDDNDTKKDAAWLSLLQNTIEQGRESNRISSRQTDIFAQLSAEQKVVREQTATISARIDSLQSSNSEILGKVNSIASAGQTRDKALSEMPGIITRDVRADISQVSDKLITTITNHIDVRFEALKFEIRETPKQILAPVIEAAKRDIIAEIGKLGSKEATPNA